MTSPDLFRTLYRSMRPCVSRAALVLLVGLMAMGCKQGARDDGAIELPSIGGDRGGPRGVYAVVRRADLPLNEPTDRAWALMNEQLVAPLQRGAWHGNGLRLGVLRRDKLDAFAEAMPAPLAFGETVVNKSTYPVPILESTQLRAEVQFTIDLTRPPRPRAVETVTGGKGSTLRLLARIETDELGRHALVLTPHHFVPSPFDLVPRDPLEKELDGRVFDELTTRVRLNEDQIAVVGIYWPWPESAAAEPGAAAANDGAESPDDTAENKTPSEVIEPPRRNDPAAPPLHLSGIGSDVGTNADRPTTEPADTEPPRLAPPQPTSFGSTLLTGTRIRQPVQSVLLITINAPPTTPDAELPGE